jgi:phosphopantothenoylcysteine decarboxylase/phosphopantothenate--cysteine ligase
MPEPDVLLEHILYEIARDKDLTGKRIVVTAGPTQEAFDPVRFVTNHSTGKMGYAIAKEAALRGADVTLVSGPVQMKAPYYVPVVPVVTAQEMYDAVVSRFGQTDIVIKAAAVADYRPRVVADEKIKKKDGDNLIEFERTKDILAELGRRKKPGQFLCGFSMETEQMVEHSRAKLEKKNLDMIVANNLKTDGAGFGTDTNIVTILTKHDMTELPLLSKEEVASALLNRILLEMSSTK